jgi:chorismate mutase / prephenate dehydratase
VIASSLCATLYHLAVVKEHIGDQESNSTRFIVLGKTGASTPGNKCSIVFSIDHKSGALSSVMNTFSGAGINLTRIESRPERSLLGRYRFFLDFEGFDHDESVKKTLEEVKKKTKTFRFLGCYRGIGT